MTRSSSSHHLRWLSTGCLAALLAACNSTTPQVDAQAPAASAQPAAQLALIPAPAMLSRSSGSFLVTADTPLHGEDAHSLGVAQQFSALLASGRGIKLDAAGGKAASGIRFRLDPSRHTGGDEAYLLQVDASGVQVSAAQPAGLFYGAMTLLQLLTADSSEAAVLPHLRIEDAPRFSWRGFMLDPSRHFWTVEQTKQVIDAMALHKLNTLHWHLTDDQGWRVEVKRYPKLTEVGGCRIPSGDSALDATTGKPRHYCGFYTQDQVREVVAYAAQRHITVVPEVNVPGHATAAISAYPEIGTISTPLLPSSEWGVFPNLVNAEESTYQFLENVIEELLPLFPGRYFHVGGDEAVKDQWEASPRIQQRMRELGASTEMELQSHLVARLEKFLAGHGKRLIGWDEILEGPMPQEATVMSWRGTEGGLKAARQGHDVVMAPSSHLYLDYLQTESPNEPPGRPATITLKQVYEFEPVPAGLEADKHAHILGVQANLWTEHTRTFDRHWHHLFPRLSALAEIAWSPSSTRDYANFLQRLPTQVQRYQRWNIGYGLTPFQVDAKAEAVAGTDKVKVSLDNPLGYEVRYSIDGTPADATSPLYRGSLELPLPAKLSTAAFFNGKPLAPSRQYSWDALSLLSRSDEQLDLCPDAGRLLLRLEDDGPWDGERAIFNATIFYPCWQWNGAQMDQVSSIKVRAGKIPYYFQLAHDEPHRRFEPARSAHGELDIHAGGCKGPRVASVPLPPRPGADGFVELSASLDKPLTGAQDLCVRFTGDTRPDMWSLDRLTLQLN